MTKCWHRSQLNSEIGYVVNAPPRKDNFRMFEASPHSFRAKFYYWLTGRELSQRCPKWSHVRVERRPPEVSLLAAGDLHWQASKTVAGLWFISWLTETEQLYAASKRPIQHGANIRLKGCNILAQTTHEWCISTTQNCPSRPTNRPATAGGR